MSTFFSRLLAVGIIAGGFALTGDLGRLASRGRDVLNARDVPASEPAATETAAVDPATKGPTTAGSEPSAGTPGREVDFRPLRDVVDRVDVSALDAGDRVMVWLAVPRGSGGRVFRCLVLDMIDAAGSEALAYEAVSQAADGSPKATAAPPRRVRIRGDGPEGTLTTGGALEIQRRGVAADGVGHDRLGPIVALGLVH